MTGVLKQYGSSNKVCANIDITLKRIDPTDTNESSSSSTQSSKGGVNVYDLEVSELITKLNEVLSKTRAFKTLRIKMKDGSIKIIDLSQIEEILSLP